LLYEYCLNRLGITNRSTDPSSLTSIDNVLKDRVETSPTIIQWDRYSPEAVRAYHAGRFLLGAGHPDTAGEYLNRARSLGLPDASLFLGLHTLSVGNHAAARTLFEEFLSRADTTTTDPTETLNLAQAHALIGLIAHEAGDSLTARAELDRAVALHDEPEFLRSRASVAVEQNRYTDALNDLDRIIRSGQAGTDDFQNRGNLNMSQNLFGAAIHDYTVVLLAEPANMDIRERRAEAFGRINEFTRAIADLDTLITASPDVVDWVYRRGYFHFRNGDLSLADTDLQKAEVLSPDSAPIHATRGQVLLQMNRFGEALAKFRQASEADPLEPDYLNFQTSALVYLERYDEAISVYHRLQNLNDTLDVPVYLSMVETEIIMGHPEVAKTSLDSITTLTLPPAQDIVRVYLRMVACELTGIDYTPLIGQWNQLLTKAPNLQWWSFVFFNSYLDKPGLSEVQKTRFREWTKAMEQLRTKE
jgi:tetratricopeptide (TPR) repeat protein